MKPLTKVHKNVIFETPLLTIEQPAVFVDVTFRCDRIVSKVRGTVFVTCNFEECDPVPEDIEHCVFVGCVFNVDTFDVRLFTGENTFR